MCCGFDPIYDKADKLTIVILQQQIFYQLQLRRDNVLKAKLGMGFLIALLIALTSSHVLAGVTGFNVLVPRLGGSANTNVTRKDTAIQQWQVHNISVGGNKTVHFRPERQSGTSVGSWVAGTSGSHIDAPYSPDQPIGTMIYLKIGTSIFEPVTVQVSDKFNSN